MDDHQLVLAPKRVDPEDVPEKAEAIKEMPEAGAISQAGRQSRGYVAYWNKPVKPVTQKIDISYEPGAVVRQKNVQISIDHEEHSNLPTYSLKISKSQRRQSGRSNSGLRPAKGIIK